MFEPKISRLGKLAEEFPERIEEVASLLDNKTNVYIDVANVRPWSNKLGWHVEWKRLKQFYDSFSNVNAVKFYDGVLGGDDESQQRMEVIKRCGYEVFTKPVKIMNPSIDVSSISSDSPDILRSFIRASLLRQLKVEEIEYLNSILLKLNKEGKMYLEDRKCNFDVELGSHMMIDNIQDDAENYILWSGDSDFHYPLQELLNAGRKVILFSTARRVASELNDLRSQGLIIFEIKKIREFICWSREMIKR